MPPLKTQTAFAQSIIPVFTAYVYSKRILLILMTYYDNDSCTPDRTVYDQ